MAKVDYEEKSDYSVYPAEVRADLDDEQDQKSFEYSEELKSPGNGKWLEFPAGVIGAAIEIEVPASGEGYAEATIAPLSRVRDNSAIGTQWDKGSVTGTTQDYVIPVTAVRGVNVSGTIKINVRMQ